MNNSVFFQLGCGVVVVYNTTKVYIKIIPAKFFFKKMAGIEKYYCVSVLIGTRYAVQYVSGRQRLRYSRARLQGMNTELSLGISGIGFSLRSVSR